MKKLLVLLLLSPLAFAEDNLPKSLYCEVGHTYAEFHFNDDGVNWFKVADSFKSLEKRTVIKNLKVTPRTISFNQRCGLLCGTTIFTINRTTGAISGYSGSGMCQTEKPLREKKF